MPRKATKTAAVACRALMEKSIGMTESDQELKEIKEILGHKTGARAGSHAVVVATKVVPSHNGVSLPWEFRM